MIALSLIARELRAAARQPFTYTVRTMAVSAALLVSLVVAMDGDLGADFGGRLFGYLHGVVLGSIWVLVPFLTADCISRERREGTLALLFLTPLKPRAIVLAKGLAHGLRAFSLWLATVPALAIPFLTGGVGWREVVVSLLVNLSSLCLTLGIGVLASAHCRVWLRSLALAACLSMAFGVLYLLAAGLLVGAAVMQPVSSWWTQSNVFSSLFEAGYYFLLDLGGAWQSLGLRPVPTGSLLQGYAGLTLWAALVLLLLIQWAAWRLQRAWQERPLAAWRIRLSNRLCTPVFFRATFRRWMDWELRRNPIGWLERRTWSGRLVMWTWFAIVISVYSTLIANLWLYQRGFHSVQALLAWSLAGSLAASAAGSFRRERETGVLELLLVAPLRESAIISGRVRGLWGQFLPAILLLLGVWLYCASFLGRMSEEVGSVCFYGVTFLTLPVVGLFFSLKTINFVSAFVRTLLVCLVIPALLDRFDDCLNFFLYLIGSPPIGTGAEAPHPFLPLLAQLGVAGFCAWRLHANLRHRRFALEAR